MNRAYELSSPNKTHRQKVLAIVPHLHPYVKHRLYIAENSGVLPRNMYCSNGVIDDAIVTLYSDDTIMDLNIISLELHFFKAVNQCLDELYEREGWHQYNISTTALLHEELNRLEESYTSEGDTIIMYEELTDICYLQQRQKRKRRFIYSDRDSEMLRIIDDIHKPMARKQKLLGKFYSWLPLETSKIIDLFVFGKLNFEEIAIVMNQSAYEIKEVVISVRKSFRRNLV